jgi:hypothetical protein
MSSRSVCEVCGLVWSLAIITGTAYVVFVLGANGWWFALAAFLVGIWSCKGMTP